MSADGVIGRVAVLCLTPSAGGAARRLASSLDADLHVHSLVQSRSEDLVFERIAERVGSLWDGRDQLVVFAPTGVVVRSIAPLLRHKTRDPGVVVVDALARWAIPVAGGHEGGANALAWLVSNILGAEPVVTTASEAVRDLVVGVGCRRGVSTESVLDAVRAALESLALPFEQIRLLATASPKRGEAGLFGAASALGVPLQVVHDLEIRSRRRVRRTAAARRVGLPAVSHPAALAAGRRTECLLNGFRLGPVMVSIARERSGWWDSVPETPGTARPRP